MKPARRYALLLLLVAAFAHTLAQTPEDEVARYIAKLEAGQIDEVKKALPDLSTRYQNGPGILYLQGRLASDGIDAVKLYQSVVDNFPQSEWADDALFHIYQYYYAMGLYRTAGLKMQQLRSDYPSSPFLTGKPIPAVTLKDEAVKLPSKEPVQLDSIPTVGEVTSTALPRESFAIQTGAFSTAANAEKQRTFFRKLGYGVEVTNKVRGGKSLYLVWVGAFPTAAAAKLFGREIKSKHRIDSIIVEKY